MKLKIVFINEIGKTIVNLADEPQYYYYTEKNELIISIEYPCKNTQIKAGFQFGDSLIFEFKGTGPGYNLNKDQLKIHTNLKKDNQFHFYIRIPHKNILYILPNDKGNLNWNHKSKIGGIFTFKNKITLNSSNKLK